MIGNNCFKSCPCYVIKLLIIIECVRKKLSFGLPTRWNKPAKVHRRGSLEIFYILPGGATQYTMQLICAFVFAYVNHSRGAEMTGQLRLYGKYEQLRYCTLDNRSIAVLIMCLHPKKISQTHTQRDSDTLYLSCR